MRDFLDMARAGGGRPSSAELSDQTLRANQGPAINQAQMTADAALVQPPIGSSMEWNGQSDPPDGMWMIEDGRILNQADYPDLFAITGTTFNMGGEGAGQFRIPDSRGRVAVGVGAGSGLTNRTLGDRFGNETHVLLESEMPSHNHGGTQPIGTAGDHYHGGDNYATFTTRLVVGGTPKTDEVMWSWTDQLGTTDTAGSHTHSFNLPFNGLNNAHNNIQPSIGKSKIIRVQ